MVPKLEYIDSFDRPELQPYQTMRRQEEHRRQGIFVAEGEKVVRRLLESRLEMLSVLLPERWADELRPLLERRGESVRVFVAEKKLLETLTGFSMYQGLLAVGRVPPQPDLEQLLAHSGRPWLFVAADSLTSAQNMGALVRNCAALGAHALLVGETCCSPYIRRAVRGSMGTVFNLPVIETSSLTGLLADLRRRGIRTVAAHAHADQLTIAQCALARDCCIVLGSEGYGISPDVLEMCDDAALIPMSPGVDSLNVVSAGAVFLYEAGRQRGRMNAAQPK